MELQKCQDCGKVFAGNSKDLCPDCHQKELNKFRIVKDYLWDNPGATVDEIYQKTGIEQKLIRKFVRDGRFRRN